MSVETSLRWARVWVFFGASIACVLIGLVFGETFFDITLLVLSAYVLGYILVLLFVPVKEWESLFFEKVQGTFGPRLESIWSALESPVNLVFVGVFIGMGLLLPVLEVFFVALLALLCVLMIVVMVVYFIFAPFRASKPFM